MGKLIDGGRYINANASSCTDDSKGIPPPSHVMHASAYTHTYIYTHICVYVNITIYRSSN